MTDVSVEVPGRPGRLSPLAWPFGLLMRGLDRLSHVVDGSEISRSHGAARIRRALALLFVAYGLALSVLAIARGGLPSWGQVLMLMMAAALFTNRGGRFVRDWVPVILGLLAYSLAGQFAERLDFTVHYTPQIDAERLLALGTIPTVWLQDHLYHGRTGPLEIFSMVMYLSHFFAPLLLGFYLWWRRAPRAFTALMFGILTVSVLGEITFVLAPTAPPWLAAQQGLLEPVHHVIKQGLYDLNVHQAAALYGSAGSYNIVAAVPSLHVAWPVIALLVIRGYGLPPWLLALQVAQLVGVVFAIVYTGEHYLVDGVVGAAYAVGAWWLVQRALREAPEAAGRPRRPAAIGPALESEH